MTFLLNPEKGQSSWTLESVLSDAPFFESAIFNPLKTIFDFPAADIVDLTAKTECVDQAGDVTADNTDWPDIDWNNFDKNVGSTMSNESGEREAVFHTLEDTE